MCPQLAQRQRGCRPPDGNQQGSQQEPGRNRDAGVLLRPLGDEEEKKEHRHDADKPTGPGPHQLLFESHAAGALVDAERLSYHHEENRRDGRRGPGFLVPRLSPGVGWQPKRGVNQHEIDDAHDGGQFGVRGAAPVGGFLARHQGFGNSIGIADAFLTSSLRMAKGRVNHRHAPIHGIAAFDCAPQRLCAESVQPGPDYAE